MKLLVLITVIASASSAFAQSNHEVRGYTKSDGTYVAPHYQTNPNGTREDNYSSKPNVNPYTGQPGTRDPYAVKPAFNPYEIKPVTPQ